MCRSSSTPVNEEEKKEEEVINFRRTVTGGSKCRCVLVLDLFMMITCADVYLFPNHVIKSNLMYSLREQSYIGFGYYKYSGIIDVNLGIHLCSCFHQQREEKQLEASVESLISRVAHVKTALHSFIYKLENEYERLMW